MIAAILPIILSIRLIEFMALNVYNLHYLCPYNTLLIMAMDYVW